MKRNYPETTYVFYGRRGIYITIRDTFLTHLKVKNLGIQKNKNITHMILLYLAERRKMSQ